MSLAKTYLQQSRMLSVTSGAKAGRAALDKAARLFESRSAGYADDFERMELLAHTYEAQAEFLGGTDQIPEAIAAIEKMIAVAEQYWRTHPDEKRANSALASVYNNAGILSDPRLPPVEFARRTISLLRKSIAIEEKLLALEPHDEQRQISIDNGYFNLGNAQYDAGEMTAAIESYRRAAPGMAKAASDIDDARAQWLLAMFDTGLAKALVKTGNTAEAAPLFARAEATIKTLLENGGDTLRLQFGIAQIDIRRGEMYLLLANDPRLSMAQRRVHWRTARESLSHGVGLLKVVNDVVLLTGPNKKLWDDGIAALARTESGFAAQSGGNL